MPTIAYLRVSTGGQDLVQQKLAVLDYAHTHRLTVDTFLETHQSAQRAGHHEELLQLIATLQPGDQLIVSELSRLGRSLGQILHIVDGVIRQGVRLVAIKEALRFAGAPNLQTKAMVALFGLFAEVERDLIAARTKEGLAAAKARGKRLGRPPGAFSRSKLEDKADDIRALLQKNVSKASIARIMDVAQSTLHHFIRTRQLQAKKSGRD